MFPVNSPDNSLCTGGADSFPRFPLSEYEKPVAVGDSKLLDMSYGESTENLQPLWDPGSPPSASLVEKQD